MNGLATAHSVPAVAVIVTCYNLGRYLDEAIASVASQSFQDFELVIVDDGSTDAETLQRLEAFEHTGTRVIRSSNRGLPAARNLGIAHTSARYICSVDADDVLEPALLEKSVAVLEREPGTAFVSHWLRAFGDEVWDWAPTRCDFPALLDTNTVNGAALVRRDVVAAVGGFDESMRDGCEDWDFWISAVERGFEGRIIPEFLFRYRRRFDSMSRVMLAGDTHPRLYRRIAEKHLATFRQHLPHLLLRRERDRAHLSRQNLDLEMEQARWLLPELAQRRDDVAVLERRAQHRERWQALRENVTNLQRAHAASQTALAAAERTLAEAETRHRVAEQQAAEALSTAESTLATTTSALTEATSALAEAASALAEADSGRRAAEQQVEEARDAVRSRSHALDLAVARAYELDARMHHAESMLAEMRASWSWRLTAPLRAMAGILRRSARRES